MDGMKGGIIRDFVIIHQLSLDEPLPKVDVLDHPNLSIEEVVQDFIQQGCPDDVYLTVSPLGFQYTLPGRKEPITEFLHYAYLEIDEDFWGPLDFSDASPPYHQLGPFDDDNLSILLDYMTSFMGKYKKNLHVNLSGYFHLN